MRQHKKRIIGRKRFPDVHFREPLPAFNRQRSSTFTVSNIHRAESPAICLQCFPMGLRCIARPFIIGVCFHDCCLRKPGCNQFLHPGTRQNIRPFRFTGVQFDCYFSAQHRTDAIINLFQPFFRKIAREVYHGAFAGARRKGHVFVAVFTGDRFFVVHIFSSF